jgi:hypothetical protein
MGPLCPIILYQLRRALLHYKSSRWPPDLKSECPLGPRKETRYNCSFLSKIPTNKPPPVSLHRVPIERDALFPEPPFNYLSEFLVNGPPMILSRTPVE